MQTLPFMSSFTSLSRNRLCVSPLTSRNAPCSYEHLSAAIHRYVGILFSVPVSAVGY